MDCQADDVSRKLKTYEDILQNIHDRIQGNSDTQPRLKQIDGEQNAEFPIIPPDSLNNSRYGYYAGTVPWIISNDDALAATKRLPDNFLDCVVTSPPYYWQRDYGVEGQTGQEDSVEEYVEALASVFREILRALKPTGTAFVVLGDTYYSGKGQPQGGDPKQVWRGVPGVSEATWNSLPNLAPGQSLCSFTHLTRPVMATIDPSPCQLRMVD